MPGVSRRMRCFLLVINLAVLAAIFLRPFGIFEATKRTTIVPVFENLTEEVNMANEEKIQLTGTSIDLVPHQVYFDARKYHSSYSNATIISISVNNKYRNVIAGCEIDGIRGKKTEVVDIDLAAFVSKYFPVTHADCFLYCFDMNVNENSEVHVLYRKNGTLIKEPVRSDSVIIPLKNAEEKDEVMVCAAGFGTVLYLEQWLTYQKTVGIKFIHINVDGSFLQNLNTSSILVNFVQTGFVKMVVWKDYLNSSQVYYYSQSLKYHDCVLRYQGTYKYMLVIDFDEYFVPFDNNITIVSYAKKLIVGKVGSVVLPRKDYCKRLVQFSLPSNGNMTKIYDVSVSWHPPEGKSLHLTKSLYQASVHRGSLLPQYKLLNYRDSPISAHCYLAHLTHKQARFKCRK